MDFRCLRCFVIVAEELHVTRAAQRLQMAQPALTRLIHRLEEDVGTSLFDRSNKRQLLLTPAGHTFLHRITPILEQYEEAVQVTQRVAQGEGGKLVVGYVALAMSTVLPAILQIYQQYPEVELITSDLQTRSLSTQLKALREHRLDVALCYTPSDERGVAHECIVRAEWVVAFPKHHSLAHLEAIPLAALSHEAWIWFKRSSHPQVYDAFLFLCRQAGFEPRIVDTSSQHPNSVINLVEAGVGIALVSEWTRHRLPVPGVVYRPLLDASYAVELHLLWRKGERSPLVQRFLQVAREVSAKQDSVLSKRT
ncbi:MAG: LysR family transcriptional regulator [Ktedonobacteraceae bacterium]|nr:LysR family transcriptional regulator [Ktedonobacteraceae bacterium]